MDTFRLPDATRIGKAHLQVSDLQRALHFYKDLIGFKEIARDGATAALSATGHSPAHVMLTARADAKPKPPRSSGLYHVAIRLPNRRELARGLRRLLEQRWPLQGFSDHGVSEAIYLADPDGNGLELYADRPREQWLWREGAIAMFTEPLDVENLLREAAAEAPPYDLHAQTDIGHVHLHVSDLNRAEAFYHGVLGLEVTQRSYPGALFLSAGGYHHHVGLNIWAGKGAPPPPPEAVGLLRFSLHVPEVRAVETLAQRLRAAGCQYQDSANTRDRPNLFTRDPDGIGIEIGVE